MQSRIEQWATVVIAACAVAVTATFLVDRAAGTRSTGLSSKPRTATATKMTALHQALLLSVALPRQQSRGRVTVVEVIDLECPFCARYNTVLDSLSMVLGDSIHISHLNYPLQFHKFAKGGAAAVDCAYQLGRGRQFVGQVYDSQDSIGFWPWDRFALQSGIADTAALNRCRQAASTDRSVDSAIAASRELGVRGTPSIFIDQWQYDQPPELQQMLRDIRLIYKGGAPK
jgi:protein-disulfide isomerase